MNGALIAANAGALITIGLGALALFTPARAATFVSVAPIGLNGTSEIRATYGGLFVALGLAGLVSQSPSTFLVAGVAWLGAAGGRFCSVALDQNLDPKNLGGIVFEGAIGTLLILPERMA